MIKHKFNCGNCEHEVSFNLFQISAIVKCHNCGKEFFVVKNKFAMILEIIILFSIALVIRTFLFVNYKMNNIFIELAIVLAFLLVFNFIFDIIFTKWIKWGKYFTLMERIAPRSSNKKK